MDKFDRKIDLPFLNDKIQKFDMIKKINKTEKKEKKDKDGIYYSINQLFCVTIGENFEK